MKSIFLLLLFTLVGMAHGQNVAVDPQTGLPLTQAETNPILVSASDSQKVRIDPMTGLPLTDPDTNSNATAGSDQPTVDIDPQTGLPLTAAEAKANSEAALSEEIKDFIHDKAIRPPKSEMVQNCLSQILTSSFSNSLNQVGQQLMLQNVYLAKTNMGPEVLTNSYGDVLTNAFFYRVSFDYVLYRTPDGGGKIKFELLPDELQKRLGYDPKVAITEEFLSYEQKKRERMQAQLAALANAASAQYAQYQRSSVKAGIRAMAEKEWPDDYDMQEFVIRQQTDAYNWVQTAIACKGMPGDVFSDIKQKAIEEWPDDYNMQEFRINQQCEAYANLHQ